LVIPTAHFLGGAQAELAVGAVHGVAGLEGDDAAPPLAGELGAQLGRRLPQRPEVVVDRHLQPLETAADGDRMGFVQQVRDPGMIGAGGAEGRLRARLEVGLPDLLDVQRRQHHPFGIAQRQHAAGLERGGELPGDVEHDRDRPEGAVGQAQGRADGVVVGPVHEAGERREAAVEQQLEVAELPRGEIPGAPVTGGRLELGGTLGRGEEIDELAAVRRDQVARGALGGTFALRGLRREDRDIRHEISSLS